MLDLYHVRITRGLSLCPLLRDVCALHLRFCTFLLPPWPQEACVEEILDEAHRAERNVAVKLKKVRCSRSTAHRVHHWASAASDSGAIAVSVVNNSHLDEAGGDI